MLLRRITKHVNDQNWFAVGIDLAIVVIGVFIGIQVANWNDAQSDRRRERLVLQNIANDIRSDLANYESAMEGAYGKITVINYALKSASVESDRNLDLFGEIDGVNYEDVVEAFFADRAREFGAIVETFDGELWGYSVQVSNVQPSTTAFDSLVSGGELGLLQEDGLVRDLQNYRYLTAGLVKAQVVTFRPARDRAIDVGIEHGLSPSYGLEKSKFLSLVSESPKIIATLRTSRGWAEAHLRMLGGAHRSATLLLERIESKLGVTENDDA